MAKKYKIVRVWDQGGDKNNLDYYNELLEKGWRPVRETPMGGRGANDKGWFASLCILESGTDDEVKNKDDGNYKDWIEAHQAAAHLKASQLMSSEDIYASFLDYDREEARKMAARLKIQQLEEAKIQAALYNPELLGASGCCGGGGGCDVGEDATHLPMAAEVAEEYDDDESYVADMTLSELVKALKKELGK